MEKLSLLIVMFATCYAEPRDLSRKVFVFPAESGDYVQLLTSMTNFSSATVCLRFITDTGDSFTLFSLSTSDHNHAFTLQWIRGRFKMQVQDRMTYFYSPQFRLNTWHYLCATWRSDNGLAQLRLDNKLAIKKYIQSGQPISGTLTATLGHDTHSEGFETFTGAITQVHMWDYVLSASQRKYYHMDKAEKNVINRFQCNWMPGNVFNWKSLEYELKGQALVDEEEDFM